MKNFTTMRIFLSGFLLISLATIGTGQDIAYTQYYLNLAGINPAFTGMEDYTDLKVAFRQGWNGFGPKNDNLFVSLYAPLGADKALSLKKNSLRVSNVPAYEKAQSDKKIRRRQGIGGMMTSRDIGAYHASNVSVNYCYHLPVSKSLTWSFGTKVAYSSQKINGDSSTYTVRDNPDLVIRGLNSTNGGNLNAASLDFGTVLYSKRFYFAVSTTNLVEKNLNATTLWTTANARQYILQTAYNAPVGPNLIWNTGIKVTDLQGYNITYAVNSRLFYKQFIYFGSAFDSVSKLSFLFGLSANGTFSLNYSYDHYLTNAGSLQLNVHEIVLGIGLFNKYKSGPRLW